MTAVDWAKSLYKGLSQLDDYDFGGTKVTDSEKNWDMKFLEKLLAILFMFHTFTLCAGKKKKEQWYGNGLRVNCH